MLAGGVTTVVDGNGAVISRHASLAVTPCQHGQIVIWVNIKATLHFEIVNPDFN